MIRFNATKCLTAIVLSAAALAACDSPQVGQTSTQISASGQRPGSPGFSVAPPNAPSGPVINNFAISVLNGIQGRSISENREYCGYIFIDQFGRLQTTPPWRVKSRQASICAVISTTASMDTSRHPAGAFG